jgi:transposase
MSLKPSPIEPVPAEMVRIARAAFRKGNPLLQPRDELGTIFSDEGFTRHSQTERLILRFDDRCRGS